jgi:hypothetical protein
MSDFITRHFERAKSDWVEMAASLRAEFANAGGLVGNRPGTKFILTWMRDLTAFEKEFGKLFRRGKVPSIGGSSPCRMNWARLSI